MSRFRPYVRTHRILVFFALAYALTAGYAGERNEE